MLPESCPQGDNPDFNCSRRSCSTTKNLSAHCCQTCADVTVAVPVKESTTTITTSDDVVGYSNAVVIAGDYNSLLNSTSHIHNATFTTSVLTANNTLFGNVSTGSDVIELEMSSTSKPFSLTSSNQPKTHSTPVNTGICNFRCQCERHFDFICWFYYRFLAIGSNFN